MWQLAESEILHASLQVWVDVDFTSYRRAYGLAFPEHDLIGMVLDHVLNRRVARLKGFKYLRLVPISRGATSSSGGLAERWSVEYHGSLHMKRINALNTAQIQYADVADLTKMLNSKTGNQLQNGVNASRLEFWIAR